MAEIIVVGGGWAGCAAALGARNAGASVVLLERTDMLLGTGLVGGIMRNNGRLTASEEMKALGAGALFECCERASVHRCVDFPGHRHADLYDGTRVHALVLALLRERGVTLRFRARVQSLDKEASGRIVAVKTRDGESFAGDAFIDATGSAGPMDHCAKYGHGCAMCVIRCPAFGGRVSVCALAGVAERDAVRADGGRGAMSGSLKLSKASLAPELRRILDETGVLVTPLPSAQAKDEAKLALKSCQQYALPEYAENLVVLDTGNAKLMAPYLRVEDLRRVPGFENAHFEDPYASGGNSMRFFGMAAHDRALRVEGVENVYCAGEKAGPLVGHTEAIVTGTLAGANAVRQVERREAVILPDTLAVGDALLFLQQRMDAGEGLSEKITFSGSVYFERMKSKGLYSTDGNEIRRRVEAAGLLGVFGEGERASQAETN